MTLQQDDWYDFSLKVTGSAGLSPPITDVQCMTPLTKITLTTMSNLPRRTFLFIWTCFEKEQERELHHVRDILNQGKNFDILIVVIEGDVNVRML